MVSVLIAGVDITAVLLESQCRYIWKLLRVVAPSSEQINNNCGNCDTNEYHRSALIISTVEWQDV